MKCLYNFSVNEFLSFVKENKMNNWWIFNKTMEERKNAICDKEYYKTLATKAKENEMNNSPEEIISWLDGISMLYESLRYSRDNEEDFLKDLRIIGELYIPYSNCRADNVLVMDNKILIIEFTYKATFQNRKEKYEEKLNQVMFYKELLSNALPEHIKIATYSFPIEVETDKCDKPKLVESVKVKKKVYANHDNCYYLGRYINDFFKNTNKSALDELNKLDDNMIINIKHKETMDK